DLYTLSLHVALPIFADERTKANLKSFGAIAGAASEMFDEQSKARRTLHGIEMTLGAIELAMTLKNTAQEIAASFARGSAAAVERSEEHTSELQSREK